VTTRSGNVCFGFQKANGLALAIAAVGATLALVAAPARAETIIDSWKTVTIPSPPELQPVTVQSAQTALLLLDFSEDICTQAKRPSCARSVPAVAKLLAAARAHKMLVVYSTGGKVSPKPVAPLAHKGDEPTVQSGVDKFQGTDLDKILSSHGIKTLIVTGTSAHGAVLYTASEAAVRNFEVIVPVDGSSAETPFAELVTAWLLKNAPGSVSAHVTLTSTPQITIR
jgi:nicotinamidase-related amidase